MRRPGFIPIAVIAFVASLLALNVPVFHPALAFHYAWDQGHDSFRPDRPPPDIDNPGDDNPCPFGSPFEVATGNLRYEERDLLIPSLGPFLNITRFYNSHDRRSGIFGNGWSFTYDRRLTLTTDGAASFAICHSPTGRRLRFVQNPDGSFAAPKNSFASLERKSDGTYSLSEKNGLKYTFDSDGKLTSITDRNNNDLQFDYDNTDFIDTITDPSGRQLAFIKGANGKVASIVDPLNRSRQYDYDDAGNLASYTDPANNQTQYVYDTDTGKLHQVVDANGHIVQLITYDDQVRVASFLEETEIWTVQYFPDRTLKAGSFGRSWTYRYNDDGSITQIVDPLGGTETYEYDENLNVTRFINKNSHAFNLEYGQDGNLIRLTDPLNNTTMLDYETTFNRLISLIDPTGRETSYEYDARGNLVAIVDALGNRTELAYDDRGNLIALTDAVGTTVQYAYDDQGDVTQTTDPLGKSSTFAHDRAGRLLAATNRNGETTTYEYDALDRITKIIDSFGEETTYTYDAVGNAIALTDALGRVTQWNYDNYDRVIQRTDHNRNIETSLMTSKAIWPVIRIRTDL